MFAKIRKGNGFGSCLNYITRVKQDSLPPEKRVWRILDSDGARVNTEEKEWRKKAATDIERPTLTRSKIKDPCGHIALGFAPEDAHRFTDEFMTQIAHEYMEAMGIRNTPYIIVRHTDTDHPHCHLMFSKVDYDGKIIRPVSNWYRNKRVCRAITERHGLTIAEDSLSLDTSKLRDAEKSRVEIRQIGHAVLKDPSLHSMRNFQDMMKARGVIVRPLWEDDETKEKLKTIIYQRGRHSFVASKIGSAYTYKSLLNKFAANRTEISPKAKPTILAAPQPSTPGIRIASVPTTSAPTPDDGGIVHGEAVSDDFKRFLADHPGMSFEEAKHRFHEEQKAKQRRIRPKFRM